MNKVRKTKDFERGHLEAGNAYVPRRSSMGKRRDEDTDLLAEMNPKVRARMADSIKTLVFFDEIGAVHQVDYLLEKTSSLISVAERALRPSY